MALKYSDRPQLIYGNQPEFRPQQEAAMMQLRLFTVHQMSLSPRQQTAERLMRWLQNMGAFVTNPMPLDPAQQLRFDVFNEDREHVLTELRKQDWAPTTGVVHMRFHRDELVPCTTYELDLPPDQPVVQDRTIRGEIVDRAKMAAEKAAIAAMHTAIYGKRK